MEKALPELVRKLLERNKRAGDFPWAEPKTTRGLAKLVAGRVAERSVYDFLDGKAVRTSTLFAILEAMGVELLIGFRSAKVFAPGVGINQRWKSTEHRTTRAQLWAEIRRQGGYSSIESAIQQVEKQYKPIAE